jgi:hypothetical protein
MFGVLAGTYPSMADPPIVAFLSTGRCGTQWLAAGLRELYPGINVEHEPIGPLYKPRKYFRCYEDAEAPLGEAAVAAHVERLVQERRPYVETGWPLFAALPLFARCFPERLRIVHLTRHPVPSALSHLAHNSYAGSGRNDAYTRWATLGAGDPGVFQANYSDRWEKLTPYEKCLFWWTEVHAYGLELPGRLGSVPFLRVQSEPLLEGDRPELERLLRFIDLPWDDGFLARSGRVIDRWHHHTAEKVEPMQALDHAMTLDVAGRLAYDVAQVDVAALNARYRGQPDAGLDRVGRYESP